HMTAENAHEFERCIGAFSHPRYEIVATGEVWDGHDGVNTLLLENVTAFPDFNFDPQPLQHGDDAVFVEGRFRGTHKGNWRGIPATGQKIDFPLIIVFVFEGDRMVCERTYFDLGTILRQLGVAA
ncbi:MAG: ester cyclase, partial [Gemmatimonadaceae bacterium]